MKAAIVFLLCAPALRAATLPMDSARGEALFISQGCIQCHHLKGAGGISPPDLGRVLDRGYTPADLASTMWNHAPVMWTAIQERGIATGDLDDHAAADLFAAFLSARWFEMRGDAGRGKRLFESLSCAACHGIHESLNLSASPVSQWRTLGDPAGLVGAMWNHSPQMRAELAKRHLAWPKLSAQGFSDLLVYLRNAVTPVSDGPGFHIDQTENGAKLFEVKGCAACHRPDEPPARLTLTGVAAAMWNHASLQHAVPPGIEAVRIDTAEMRELLSYYWAKRFFDAPGNAARGRRIYAAKRCVSCHADAGPGPVLSAKAGSYTAITMLSSLWRHGPAMLADMQQRKIAWPQFRAGEMEDLIAALNDPRTGK
jgi:mono/diheme cytochrome c family protein